MSIQDTLNILIGIQGLTLGVVGIGWMLINAKIEGVYTRLSFRMERLETRMKSIENRMSHLEDRMKKLEGNHV